MNVQQRCYLVEYESQCEWLDVRDGERRWEHLGVFVTLDANRIGVALLRWDQLGPLLQSVRQHKFASTP